MLPGVTSYSGGMSLDHFLQCWCPDALLGSQSDCELGATEPHSSHEVTLACCRLQLSTHSDWGGLKDTWQQVLPDFKATGHVCWEWKRGSFKGTGSFLQSTHRVEP